MFAEITYGKVPALSKFKFLVIYGDPAPGENKTKKSSTKTVCLLGKLAGRLYLIKTFLDRGLNAEFVEWYIKLLEFVGGKTTVYCYMENNKLQDPFFQPHVSRRTWNRSTGRGTWYSTRPKRTTRT